MGLIALIDSRPADKPLKKRGDIIAVKLADSPWGLREVEQFVLIEFEDDELEAELALERLKGEAHPVSIYPYAEYEPAKDPILGPEMVTRSRFKFDLSAIPDDVISATGKTREQVLDRTTAVRRPLRPGEFTRYTKTELTDVSAVISRER